MILSRKGSFMNHLNCSSAFVKQGKNRYDKNACKKLHMPKRGEER
ncbi:hypothetical protein B4119_2570 [Parageobacillus caldoxylosilyticus]|uniref:Uncharacterized protein n=1 Tax=Saccharococcus caldoxylosilyticus TaxID=81408 RepID=A0A150LD73_9BACL|nr:hypothetical protein B4119_2570 [Parageobacillus caldoxylosilyticus]